MLPEKSRSKINFGAKHGYIREGFRHSTFILIEFFGAKSGIKSIVGDSRQGSFAKER
jgi:hypothetical protein